MKIHIVFLLPWYYLKYIMRIIMCAKNINCLFYNRELSSVFSSWLLLSNPSHVSDAAWFSSFFREWSFVLVFRNDGQIGKYLSTEMPFNLSCKHGRSYILSSAFSVPLLVISCPIQDKMPRSLSVPIQMHKCLWIYRICI